MLKVNANMNRLSVLYSPYAHTSKKVLWNYLASHLPTKWVTFPSVIIVLPGLYLINIYHPYIPSEDEFHLKFPIPILKDCCNIKICTFCATNSSCTDSSLIMVPYFMYSVLCVTKVTCIMKRIMVRTTALPFKTMCSESFS